MGGGAGIPCQIYVDEASYKINVTMLDVKLYHWYFVHHSLPLRSYNHAMHTQHYFVCVV